VSPKHANFLINNGGATSDDMMKLIGLIKEKVKERFDVDLECEWVLVNF
jgi:UDP-N-acetylmuramate dehydrogenase